MKAEYKDFREGSFPGSLVAPISPSTPMTNGNFKRYYPGGLMRVFLQDFCAILNKQNRSTANFVYRKQSRACYGFAPSFRRVITGGGVCCSYCAVSDIQVCIAAVWAASANNAM